MALLRPNKVYEAFQFTGEQDAPGWPEDWILEASGGVSEDGETVFVRTKDGVSSAQKGSWILKDPENGSMSVASNEAVQYLFDFLSPKGGK